MSFFAHIKKHLQPGTAEARSSIAKILIIGETDSGKSTFINYLNNYFEKGYYEKPMIVTPTRNYSRITETPGLYENSVDYDTISRTDACHQYSFHDRSTTRQYLFLDTPGLVDTRDIQQYQLNMTAILNAISVLQDLTCMIIVVNGSMARVTVNFQTVMSSLRGNVPDTVMDNVILIHTHVQRQQSTFDIEKNLKLNGTTVYPYYMQNSAFSQDSTKWSQLERQQIERDWIQSMDEIDKILSVIKIFQTKSVAIFDDMRKVRNSIKINMHETRLEIAKIQQLIYDQVVKKYGDKEVSSRSFTQGQTVKVNELLGAHYYSTICAKCNVVCHENCSLDENTEVGDQIFQQCSALGCQHQCNQCPEKCSYMDHYHAKKTMKTSKQNLVTVLQGIKVEFDSVTKNKGGSQKKSSSVQSTRRLLEQAFKQKIDDVKMKCSELRKLCGGFDLVHELHILVEQLKDEARITNSPEAINQAEMVIRELNTFCLNLEAEDHTVLVSRAEMIVFDTSANSEMIDKELTKNTKKQVRESSDTVTAVEKFLGNKGKQQKTAGSVTDSAEESYYVDLEENNQDKHKERCDKPSALNPQKTAVQKHRPVNDISASVPPDSTPHSGASRSVTTTSTHEHQEEIYAVTSPTSKAVMPKYELMSINDLVDDLRAAIAERRPKAAIERELRNRAQGITCPMTTAHDRAMFVRYTKKYAERSPGDISTQYMRLQRQINSQLGDADMNIERITTIPPELLVETAVLYTLFSNEELSTDDGDREFHDHKDIQPAPPPIPSRPQRSADRPVRPSSYHADAALQSSLHSSTRRDINTPQPVELEFYDNDKIGPPPSYDDAVFRRNNSLVSSQSGPTPMIQQVQSDQEQVKNKKSLETLSSSPSVAASRVDTYKDGQSSGQEPDFTAMETEKLLYLYSQARKRENSVREVDIYTELERRCNGKDNRLMTDPIMKQTLAAYRQLETSILQKKFDAMKNNIRKLTNNGNATRINNVPKDMLIEITAMASLLQDRL